MFSGIISHVGQITHTQQSGDLTIRIESGLDASRMKLGDSIACNGCCLTVTDFGNEGKKSFFTADLSAETLRCTAEGMWANGKKVNLETSLRMGDSLDGHMVSGHVDGVAKLMKLEKEGDSHALEFVAPEALARFLAPKGSVTLNGVSLTLNRVEGAAFSVNIIPHTWALTNLGQLREGDCVNLEIDLIARYVARLLAPQL